MHLVIDADYLSYKIGFACQKPVEGSDEVVVEPLPHVLATVKRSLNNTTESLRALKTVDSIKIYLTGRGNFRETLYPEYKANRTQEKPLLYHQIRNYLVEHWGAQVVEGMEADDACSLAAVCDPDTVIISPDKDLLTVPGWHYNPGKPDEGLLYITPGEASRLFYKQLLMGDAVDNIKGCGPVAKDIKKKYKLRANTFGEKGAETVLKHCDENDVDYFHAVAECYHERGDEGLEDMLLQGQLLHMTRELDENGDPVLWQLPE